MTREKGTAKQEDMIGVHELTMQTIANNRRSKARGDLLRSHNENLDLLDQKAKLERENDELHALVEAVSALARTSLINSLALRQTIRHLRDTWKEDAPESTARQRVDDALEAFYNDVYDTSMASPEVNQKANQSIEAAKARARENLRAQSIR